MAYLKLTAVAVFCLAVGCSANIDTPRYHKGVEFSRISLYNQGKEFTCLDGSKTIPAEQINDDYCDCPDGSDEPGTSACSNGKFYCANKLHKAEYIPSSRVNDGICDCCDGSDEWDGRHTCENICDELGRSAREERQRKAAVARKGFSARQELAKQGEQMKEEKVNAALPLKTERDELQPQKDVLNNKKNELEEKERTLKDAHKNAWQASKDEKKKLKASALFVEIDTNKDQKITLAEVVALAYLDNDHDGVVTEAEAKIYINVEEADLDHFTSQMYDTLSLTKKNHELDKKEQQAVDDDLVADEDKHPEPEDLPADEHDEEDDEVMPPYDEETQAAINAADAARTEYNDMDRKIREIDDKIREADAFSQQDFGSDLAWAPLKGQCFELSELQYVYKMCPFDRTVQKDKNGYGETSLGSFKEWSGKVPRKYAEQMYADGQQCWNGPKRSTKVVIECGETNELVSASEPAKCEYEFLFRTPAACNDPDKEEPVHVEL